MVDGQGADREAPAAAVVNREIGDGVGATRHEAAPGKHLDRATLRNRTNFDIIGGPCRQTRSGQAAAGIVRST